MNTEDPHQTAFEGNFLPQVYVENAKNSFYADTPDNYNFLFLRVQVAT